jgi:hypothetical protein
MSKLYGTIKLIFIRFITKAIWPNPSKFFQLPFRNSIKAEKHLIFFVSFDFNFIHSKVSVRKLKKNFNNENFFRNCSDNFPNEN